MIDRQKRPFHFHALGFQRNPFGALSNEEWVAVAILTPTVQEQLETGEHVQLIGPKGSGKSTTLRRLTAHLQNQIPDAKIAYEYLPEGMSRFETTLNRLDVFLLDEAQRLNWWERNRWLRGVKNGRLRTIFSSHEELAPLFRRKKLPLKTVELDTEITPRLYQEILWRRLSTFAIDNQPQVTFADDAIAFLYGTFKLDLREAEYFLYEVWQRLEGVGEITAVSLQKHYQQYQTLFTS